MSIESNNCPANTEQLRKSTILSITLDGEEVLDLRGLTQQETLEKIDNEMPAILRKYYKLP